MTPIVNNGLEMTPTKIYRCPAKETSNKSYNEQIKYNNIYTSTSLNLRSSQQFDKIIQPVFISTTSTQHDKQIL